MNINQDMEPAESVEEGYKKSKRIRNQYNMPALVAIKEDRSPYDYLGPIEYKEYKNGLLIVDLTNEEPISIVYGLADDWASRTFLKHGIHNNLVNFVSETDMIETVRSYSVINSAHAELFQNYKLLLSRCKKIQNNLPHEDMNKLEKDIRQCKFSLNNFCSSLFSFTRKFENNRGNIGDVAQYVSNDYNEWRFMEANELLGLRHYIKKYGEVPIRWVHRNGNTHIIVWYHDFLYENDAWYSRETNPITDESMDAYDFFFDDRSGKYLDIIDESYECMNVLEEISDEIDERYEDTLTEDMEKELSETRSALLIDDTESQNSEPS